MSGTASTRRSRPEVTLELAARRERDSPVILGLEILLLVTSVLLIVLVLLHKGKGGGLSDLFGGGVSTSLGGSSVAERNLDRVTVGVGLIWAATIIALGLITKS